MNIPFGISAYPIIIMHDKDKSSSFLMDPKKRTNRRPLPRQKTKDGDGDDEHEGDISMASMWQNFLNSTTSGGVSHIDSSKGKIKKIVWVTLSLLCFVGLIFNLYLLISKYLKYNVNVSVKIEQAKAMAFPAVTICNNNPIKKSYMDDTEGFNEILSTYKSEIMRMNCSASEIRDPSNQTSSPTMVSCFPTSGLTEDGRKQRSDFRLLNLIQEKLLTMSIEKRLRAGHHLRNMIFDCEFSGGLCSLEKDFEYSFNSYYGNCYTFNFFKNVNDTKTSRRAGPRYGLSITFDVEQNEYVGEISQSAGLRVVVHDPMRMPFPEDDAILVSPRALTHIGITMVKSEKLNGSYGNCYAEGSKKITVYQEMLNLKYCEKGCQYTCLSIAIVRKCSCVYAKFALSKSRLLGLRPCTHDNSTQRICIESIFEDGILKCKPKCPVPCRETIFRPSVSSDIWPSNSYLAYFREFLSIPSSNSSSTLDDYGKFIVYFENLAYEFMTESPEYEMHELLSDIGGALGLYLGFSLLTLIEFVELFYDFGRVGIILIFRYLMRQNKRQSAPSGA